MQLFILSWPYFASMGPGHFQIILLKSVLAVSKRGLDWSWVALVGLDLRLLPLDFDEPALDKGP